MKADSNRETWIPLEIPDGLTESPDPSLLSPGWLDGEPGTASRPAGDAWLKSARSTILSVPSVVTPDEWNHLLNPRHPDFTKIRTGNPRPFRPDPRRVR